MTGSSQLQRKAMLALPPRVRLAWFIDQFCGHRALNRVINHFSELVDPLDKTKIIAVVGPTGVGKSIFGEKLAPAILNEYHNDIRADEIPCISVVADSDRGIKSFDWGNFYSTVLLEGLEIDVERKAEYSVRDGKLFISSIGTVPAKKKACKNMIKRRKTQLVIVDEAAHMLTSPDYKRTMDTLKSFVEAMGKSKILLVGPYELVELLTAYGQVGRRMRIIHFQRYLCARQNERDEFKRTLKRFMSMWPCVEVPDLDKFSDEIMKACCGCVGILKETLDAAAKLQIRQMGERWSQALLVKALPTVGVMAQLDAEASIGEALIKNFAYDEILVS